MTIDGLPDVKRGVGTDVSEDPTTGLTLTEMRTKASYAGWDFDTIWAIDTNKNGGLPYLRWQDDVPTVIEPTSLTLSAETVTLAAGRSTTLTAVFSPIGAGGKPTWSCAGRRVSHSWRTGRSPQGGHCDHHSLLWQLASKLLRDSHGAKQRRIHDP